MTSSNEAPPQTGPIEAAVRDSPKLRAGLRRSLVGPEVIVFDLGKVLLDFDYSVAARRIATRSRSSPEQVAQFLELSPLQQQYELGLLNRTRFFEQIVAATGFDGSLEEFSLFFADIFWPIEPMVELHARLRARGYPTYVFSNTNDLAIEHIQRSFPFYSQFTGYILSYEHGLMKPDPRLYQVVEQQTGRAGPAILYLDDRPENAEAGRARGWTVILQQTPEQSWTQVRQLGLLAEQGRDPSPPVATPT